MEYLYVITLIILAINFIIYKKTEEKLSFVKWLIITILTIISYNIVVGMFFGLIGISANLSILVVVNLLISLLMSYKNIKTKEYQKYYYCKKEIAGLILIIIFFGIMLVKDMKIQNGDIVHIAIDSSIHYRAAKHYADTMMAFINVEDKTFFNFNIMQTGAYINDGILMRVVTSITDRKISYEHCYEFFECLMVFMCGLGLYGIFMDKIKGKMGFILSMAFYLLFIYGYPYNSYLYGFSYLTVGMVIITSIIIIMELLYSKENISKNFLIILIGVNCFGLIFSYCLFAPVVFAGICIYTFIKDFKEKGKTYFKIFKATTIKITIILFIVALIGVFYFIVPAYFINDQEPVSEAIGFDGAIYSEFWRDIIYYVPFGLLYAITLIKRFISKDKLEFLDIFSIVYVMFYGIMWIGMRKTIVSPYYFYKTYFVLWIVIFAITIDLINRYSDKKIFGKMVYTYSGVWPLFVLIIIILKASTLLPEETKRAIPNYIGMYFSENCDFRGSTLVNLNFTNEKQEIAKYVRENVEDANADNTVLITSNYNERCWATVTTEVSSENLEYRDIIQDVKIHNIREAYYEDSKKYVVSFVGSKDYEKWKEIGDFEILFQNEAGYVAKCINK